jgi:hypothetical protein
LTLLSDPKTSLWNSEPKGCKSLGGQRELAWHLDSALPEWTDSNRNVFNFPVDYAEQIEGEDCVIKITWPAVL